MFQNDAERGEYCAPVMRPIVRIDACLGTWFYDRDTTEYLVNASHKPFRKVLAAALTAIELHKL